MKNNVWLITGGSKGIGLQLARRLIEARAQVAVTSRSKAALEAQLGDSALTLHVDLVDESSVGAAVSQTIERFGRIDVVVNNAGYGQVGALEEISDAEMRRTFDINVFGLLNVLRATLPHLRIQRSGHIFNIGSIAGWVGGFPGFGAYCATKFAVTGLTEALHAEVAPLGIRVTGVYPGYVRTEFLSPDSLRGPSKTLSDYQQPHDVVREHRESIHQHQIGDPQKLVNVLIDTANAQTPPLHLFLGSDAYNLAAERFSSLADTLEQFRSITHSTDFDHAET